MKSPLVFAMAFVAATAASTGAKLMLAKPPVKSPATTDSAKHATMGDTAKTDTAIVASGQAANPPADTLRPTGAPGAPAVPDSSRTAPAPRRPASKTTVDAKGASSASGGAAAVRSAPTDTAVEASERRIAKVFTAMDAKQAAKVLEHMTDDDVEVILGYVGPRQAASIMSELPPERVATLSKLAIKDAQSGGKR